MTVIHRGSGMAVTHVGDRDGVRRWRARPAGSVLQYAEFTTVPDMPINLVLVLAFLALRAS